MENFDISFSSVVHEIQKPILVSPPLIERTLTEINSDAGSVGNGAFYAYSTLEAIDFPSALSIGNSAFRDCIALTSIKLPAATSIGNYAFQDCTALTSANLPLVTYIGSNAFNGCEVLASLILRSETTATLNNKNAFTSTPIASGTGYIYVPSTLIESYKTATNWSTYSTQFRALEDYTVDGTITGELDPTKI